MIVAHVTIEKELAVRGWRRALRFRSIKNISYFYAVRLTIVWIIISIVNGIFDDGRLTGYHLLALTIVWLVATLARYINWYREIGENTVGWEFDVVLDDDGVTSKSHSSMTRNWSFYKQYREYDDYLEIEDSDGNITFLPKTNDMQELVEFTKAHIAERPRY